MGDALAHQLNDQAVLLSEEGRFAEAAPLLERALEEWGGSKDAERMSTLRNLAIVSEKLGDRARALELFVQVLGWERVRYREDDPQLADALHDVAGHIFRAGDVASAESLVREALEIQRNAFGEDDLAVAATMSDLGRIRKAAGDLDEAIPLLERALAVRRAARPPDVEAVADSLAALAEVASDRKDWVNAKRLWGEATEMFRTAFGDDSLILAQALGELARAHQESGDLRAAILPLQRARDIWQAAVGIDHPSYAMALNNLADAHYRLREWHEAETLYEEAAGVTRRAYGAEHPITADVLNNLANTLRAQGDFDEAERIYRDVLEIQRRHRGDDDERVHRVLGDLAELAEHKAHPGSDDDDPARLDALAVEYLERTEWAIAERLARRALDVSSARFGDHSPERAHSLVVLARIAGLRGQSDDAEAAYEQALDIARTHPGAGGTVGAALAGLAEGRRRSGDLPAAEALFREALGLAHSVYGPKSIAYQRTLRSLAVTLVEQNRFDEAEPLLREAIDAARAASGASELPAALAALGDLHRRCGEHAAAEPLLEDALTLDTERLGPDHPDTGRHLNQLGILLQDMGRSGAAVPLLERALEVTTAAFGSVHPDTIAVSVNLALSLASLGDLQRAERLLLESRAAQLRRSDGRDARYARTLVVLGSVYRVWGRRRDAEPVLREATELLTDLLPPDAPAVVESLEGLAALYLEIGAYETAETFLTRALAARRRGPAPMRLGEPGVLVRLGQVRRARGDLSGASGRLEQAIAFLRRSSPSARSELAHALGELAQVRIAAGEAEPALRLLEEAAAIDADVAVEILSATSPEVRLEHSREHASRLGLLLTLLADGAGDAGAVARAADVVLRRKGLIAEAMATRRDAILSGRHPHLAEPLRELGRLRSQLARTSLAAAARGEQGDTTALVGRIDELERTLARTIPDVELAGRLAAVNCAAVVEAMPAGSALVEVVLADPGADARYVAFVLLDGAPDDVRFVDLGTVEDVDSLVVDAREELTGSEEPGRDRSGGRLRDVRRSRRSRVRTAGRAAALRDALLLPLEPALGGRRKLLFAPDGELLRLPLEALPGRDGGHLIDEYAISYLSAGRDVLRFGVGSWETGPPVIVVDPDFDLRAPGAQPPPIAERTSRELNRAGIAFERLEGTRVEGDDISQLLGADGPLIGWRAVESVVKASRSPSILHLATHGFFLPGPSRTRVADVYETIHILDVPGEGRFVLDATPRLASGEGSASIQLGGALANPLLRSGLALAGANTSLRGEAAPAEAEDGILTAEDVSAIDLTGTRLVVLSACETGLGTVEVGEGVFGLRRAFVLAGAETLVMSLWQVPDQPTQLLMTRFYRELLEGKGRADALRAAQLALKGEPATSDPLCWGAFVCQGDPNPIFDAPVDGTRAATSR
jgi:tetratricopeptide (TPR) repeat protein/CHAT domain-containing protein